MRIGTITRVGIRGRWHLGFVFSLGGTSPRQVREPNRLERWIVHRWNRLVCCIGGHERILESVTDVRDDDGTFPCTACSARLRPVEATTVGTVR